jgi:hypothetical protein
MRIHLHHRLFSREAIARCEPSRASATAAMMTSRRQNGTEFHDLSKSTNLSSNAWSKACKMTCTAGELSARSATKSAVSPTSVRLSWPLLSVAAHFNCQARHNMSTFLLQLCEKSSVFSIGSGFTMLCSSRFALSTLGLLQL